MDNYYQNDYLLNRTEGDQQQYNKFYNRIKPESHVEPRLKNQELHVQQVLAVSRKKQSKIQYIWDSTPQQIEQFFVNYPIQQKINIKIHEIINSKKIKILRDNHRIYFGEIYDHKKHGRGISIYNDGQIYQGSYFNNQKQGLGYQIYQNGNVYIGQFQKNKKHGKGTFYWFSLTSDQYYQYYDGQWWAGLPSGVGYHQRANGDLYEGDFKNGLKYGEGIEHFGNGDIYVGQYMNNFPEGYGQYIWVDKSNYKGDFKQGLRDGFGIWRKSYEKNSQSYRGHYALDKRCGYGVYYWKNGNYYKGGFFDDKKHGYGQLYDNNQLLYKGMWQNGERAEHLNQGKYLKLNYQFLNKRSSEKRQKSPPPFLPRINTQRQDFIKNQIFLQKMPKFTTFTQKMPKIKRNENSQSNQKPKRRVVDMQRLNRLATSKSVPKKCGHKNCIPEHYHNSKGKHNH